nr:hypothetical protein [Bradyrhizobium sp. G127]
MPRSGATVSDPDHSNRKRNQKIAENEAARELTGDVRLSTWAIGMAIVIALIILAIFLKR